ncbi:PRC and DUF2382 domain-containing protein [Streptomyces sp. NPDC006923]|uniref:PRC and DUF2382 domain-containing protein n=1 Tax=Streptomyces sp. NPDC006923 TaxID=3155355 RepID=UPI0033D04716
MMSADGVFDNPNELNGLAVYDRDGEKIGNVGHVYVDDRTSRPEWVTVKTGLFGMKESLVPLAGARRLGEDLHVPYTKETVKDAPRLDADEHLEPSQEKQLYQHYGITGPQGGRSAMGKPLATGTAGTGAAAAGTGRGTGMGRDMATGMPAGSDMTAGGSPGPAMAGRAGAAATRGSHPAPDPGQSEELILSEEQLHISTEEHEVGRARLRKVVVTESVTTSVPLSHEEVHVIHEPIAPGERAGDGGARIGEAETEVTLHAEQPVIRKEAVPVERVRMETEKVTEQREVSSDVRKEQIEYDTGQSDKDLGGKRGPRH